MKKRIALLMIAAMLLTLTACASKTEETENPYRMKSYVEEDLRSGIINTGEFSYNEAGFLQSRTYHSNGVLNFSDTYELDEYGNELRSVTTTADGTQTITELKLTLDDQHRVIYEERYNDGTLYSTTERSFDKKGNLTAFTINRIGILNGEDWVNWTDRSYDRNGNIIRENTRWNTGEESYTLYEYENGKPVLTTHYEAGEITEQFHIEYSYDETGLIETQKKYDNSGNYLRLDITTYDEYGNVLTHETGWSDLLSNGEVFDGTIDVKYTYTYELIPTAE